MMVPRLIKTQRESFGHRADDTSCFVVYPGVIFCECGQVVVLLLSLGFFFFKKKTKQKKQKKFFWSLGGAGVG